MRPHDSRKNEELFALKENGIYSGYSSGKKRFSNHFKRALWRASGKVCAYCGEELETFHDMSIDHFIPVCRGRDDSIENLVCSCRWCNSSKSQRDIESFRMNLAIKKSPMYKIISADQAMKLMEKGINLPLDQDIKFKYEKMEG